MKKVFEPVTKTMKDVSGKLTKTMMITSKDSNKALENLNNKLLGIMKDRGITASYLLFPSSKITNSEYSTQFNLVKNCNSNRVIDLLTSNSTPITLPDNWLTFCDTGRKFELKGDLLKS